MSLFATCDFGTLCGKPRECQVCRCCLEHCPGHSGLIRTLKIKQIPNVRELPKPPESEPDWDDESYEEAMGDLGL
jgi:hypothetical protein